MAILYIVPTPIGNMEDMTLRALRVLKEADVVLAEDTRTTGILLKHYGISARLLAHHKYNEHDSAAAIVDMLRKGSTVALVSDAGTPAVSDPGFLAARTVIDAGYTVECLPGATAVIPAIVDSGMPCDRFCFEGFLPVKKGRLSRLQQIAADERTTAVYESPHRLRRTLADIANVMGPQRRIAICRELTKVHEETLRMTVAEAIDYYAQTEPRGEIVIVIEGRPREHKHRQHVNKYDNINHQDS